MRIRQFADRVGLTVDTLRYYEKEGLVRPERDGSGHRRYTERDIDWMGLILRLKATGMPLAQIREYARLRYEGDETVAERHAMLLAHSQRLEHKQRELAEHRAHLEEKLRIYRRMMRQ